MTCWLNRNGIALAILATSCVAANASPKFVTVDVPGAQYAVTASINSRNVVTGTWSDGTHVHGFIRQRNGTIETFDVPGSLSTVPVSINKRGFVTGSCTLPDRPEHSLVFLRSPDGAIETFGIPKPHSIDFPVAINSKGTIVGTYVDDRSLGGFVRDRYGKITQLHLGQRTDVYATNDFGEVVGEADFQGFVRSSDGLVTYFQADGSTSPAGINNHGAITGMTGLGGAAEGFVRAADGAITIFSVGAGNYTVPAAINDDGAVAGYFYDSRAKTDRGFLRAPDGKVTKFSPSGSTKTYVFNLNNRGVIVGSYVDQQGNGHGYIRYP